MKGFAHSLADFQFPILTWEEFFLVQPCVAVHAVFGQVIAVVVWAASTRTFGSLPGRIDVVR